MNNVIVLEASDNLNNGIDFSDVREEFVSKSGSFRGFFSSRRRHT
eukprot:COSAG02_NODE_58173_length_278_cov_0.653631_1_plen_44_part_10